MQLHSKKRLLFDLTLVLVLGLILAKVYWPELVLLFNPSSAHQAELITLVHRHELVDVFLLMLVIAVLCSVPGAPNSVVCIFTGACFGPLAGFLINWCGNIIGNGFVLTMVHRSGVTANLRQKPAFSYLSRQRYPLLGLTMGFIVPFIPNLVVNCVATGLEVSRRGYLLAVSLGTLPIAFIYAYSGNAIFTLDLEKIIIIAGMLILLCVCYVVVRLLHQKESTKKG